VPDNAAGPVRFARYAFGPNLLGYCGPDAAGELFELAAAADPGPGAAPPIVDVRGIRALAQGFEGAWPYLAFIADCNGVADPLDERVVDAYWLGNPLLDACSPRAFGASLQDRFRARLRPDDWRWLATKPEAGARPVHAFHVFDVFPRVGLIRSGATDHVIEIADRCRVRWGRVLERDGDWLVVSSRPLVLEDGRLTLGASRAERVQGWRDGRGFLPPVAAGDLVSMHWDWACERLAAGQAARLVAWTASALAVANRTI
jgi:hypothetical protein